MAEEYRVLDLPRGSLRVHSEKERGGIFELVPTTLLAWSDPDQDIVNAEVRLELPGLAVSSHDGIAVRDLGEFTRRLSVALDASCGVSELAGCEGRSVLAVWIVDERCFVLVSLSDPYRMWDQQRWTCLVEQEYAQAYSVTGGFLASTAGLRAFASTLEVLMKDLRQVGHG